MPYELENRLVIGVASSAMFDLSESDAIFRRDGEEKYRKFQENNLAAPLDKGIAFSFIKRLLSFNELSNDPAEDAVVEVILLSRNDPDTGLRVMRSIQHYGLGISRAIFMQGKSSYEYIPALNIALFLSANRPDVEKAIENNLPAGLVLPSTVVDDEHDHGLRIAFDFDGVVADDESETVMQTGDLKQFHQHETEKITEPHKPGPLQQLLVRIAKIQKLEEQKKKTEPSYQSRLRISIVTARNAPSHERAMNTLKSWGVMVNDAFFLGGIAKHKVLGVLRPHIFFDDQPKHLETAASVAPSVHIPFGVANKKHRKTGESVPVNILA
jgi:5'-nucleotidase